MSYTNTDDGQRTMLLRFNVQLIYARIFYFFSFVPNFDCEFVDTGLMNSYPARRLFSRFLFHRSIAKVYIFNRSLAPK